MAPAAGGSGDPVKKALVLLLTTPEKDIIRELAAITATGKTKEEIQKSLEEVITMYGDVGSFKKRLDAIKAEATKLAGGRRRRRQTQRKQRKQRKQQKQKNRRSRKQH